MPPAANPGSRRSSQRAFTAMNWSAEEPIRRLIGIVEAAVVVRGVTVELGRLHFGPPTMARIMNSGRPLLWS